MGFLGFFRNLLNKGELKALEEKAQAIENLEPEISKLTDRQLRLKTDEFKKRLAEGETLDDILTEAYAVVREASVRTIGLRPFFVQLMGAIVLHEGRIAEMKTGEGKTLVATLPLYLNALEGKGAHLVTVNDYLAKYQSRWMGRIFTFLGLSVGCLTNDIEGEERAAQYEADITYGTNNEFGFDYLRDNMVAYKERRVQRPLNFAIVDEVDSILIDEARTPLIISGRQSKSSDLYNVADRFASSLLADDVIVDEKEKTIVLTDETGVPKAEKYFRIDNLSDLENMEISHHINQAIRARFLMKRDVDYVVKDGEVLIVDEFTGRLMPGRRYSNGLHQAIEAKEGIAIRDESQTLATITLQNFFRMYAKLSGMTGTAKTEEEEFREIYNMDVVVIPTNEEVIREDMSDLVYGKMEYKMAAIIEEIAARHATGQPILVGTISIEVSEYLSRLLKRKGIPHEVLNAKHHEREAEIIAQAGRYGAVTIATNMAGRGTDIMLGGNVEFVLRKELRKAGFDEEIIGFALSPFDYDDPQVREAKKQMEKIRPSIEAEVHEEAQKVRAVGGLHVLGTERHEARRIDLQLRGRSGRQGDPGSSQFFLSLDDDLLRIFMKEGVANMLHNLGMKEGIPIEHPQLNKVIENAQKRVESAHYGTRRYVLQYDQVMNEQRKFIYAERNRVLENTSLKDHMMTMMKEQIEMATDHYLQGEEPAQERAELFSFLKSLHLPVVQSDEEDKEALASLLVKRAHEFYEKKEAEFGAEIMRELERSILLQVVDRHWMDHIDAMDNLRRGIGLQAIGQIDPVQAYQREGFDMYTQMIESINRETLKYLFGVRISKEPAARRGFEQMATGQMRSGPAEPRKVERKIGRNEPCPCGSGKKYKYCHGRN